MQAPRTSRSKPNGNQKSTIPKNCHNEIMRVLKPASASENTSSPACQSGDIHGTGNRQYRTLTLNTRPAATPRLLATDIRVTKSNRPLAHVFSKPHQNAFERDKPQPKYSRTRLFRKMML